MLLHSQRRGGAFVDAMQDFAHKPVDMTKHLAVEHGWIDMGWHTEVTPLVSRTANAALTSAEFDTRPTGSPLADAAPGVPLPEFSTGLFQARHVAETAEVATQVAAEGRRPSCGAKDSAVAVREGDPAFIEPPPWSTSLCKDEQQAAPSKVVLHRQIMSKPIDPSSNSPVSLPEPAPLLSSSKIPEMPHVLPSLGAELHHLDACTPCKFFRSKRGCYDGATCKHCHFPHENLTYAGVRKVARQRGLAKHGLVKPNSVSI